MFVTPGRTKQLGESMSGRGELQCGRCKEFKRRDKMVAFNKNIATVPQFFCKHCRAVMVMQLRQLEKVALLSD